MKKWIALILALVMVVSLFAGCGGEQAPEKKPTKGPDSSVTQDKAVSEGCWVVEKFEMEGTEFYGEEMTGLFGPAESVMTLEFGDDGSVIAIVFDEFLKGSYSGSPDALVLDFSGKIINASCTGDKMVADVDGSPFTLKRQDNVPEVLANNPWKTYEPEFDIAQTIAMSNQMNWGYYVVEDGVLYGLTHTKSSKGMLGATPFHMKGDYPEFETTVILDDSGPASCITKIGNTLYYIIGDEKICRVNTDGSDAQVLYEGACDYLRIHEGRMYFTDENGRFVSMDMNGGDLQMVVDKEIYYPYFISSDWVVFQDDADNESLHLYNTTYGTDLNINYDVSYCPIMDGHYLYFAQPVGDVYSLCRADMSNPYEFTVECSELPLSYSSFNIDGEYIYAHNGVKVLKEDWKLLTDTGDYTAEKKMYVTEDYIIQHEFDREGYISKKYLQDRDYIGISSFR